MKIAVLLPPSQKQKIHIHFPEDIVDIRDPFSLDYDQYQCFIIDRMSDENPALKDAIEYLANEAIKHGKDLFLIGQNQLGAEEIRRFFELGGDPRYVLETDWVPSFLRLTNQSDAFVDAVSSNFLKSHKSAQVKFQSETIAVFASKGGAGKTLTSCCLAAYLADRYRATNRDGLVERLVLLLDFDTEYGDVARLMCKKRPTRTLRDWITPDYNEDLKHYVEEWNIPNLHILPAPPGLGDHLALTEATVTQVLDMTQRRYDSIIIDCDHNQTDAVALSLYRADKILMPVYFDLAALDELQKVSKLMTSIGVDPQKVYAFLNHNEPELSDWETNAQQIIKDYGWSVLPSISKHNNIRRSWMQGIVPIMNPECREYREEMIQLISQLEGNQYEPPKKPGSYLKRLIHKVGGGD